MKILNINEIGFIQLGTTLTEKATIKTMGPPGKSFEQPFFSHNWGK